METGSQCNVFAQSRRVGAPLHSSDDGKDCMQAPFASQYHMEASRHWDRFYQMNQRNFFRDRHYLDREFPVLLQPGMVMLELGCGVGNTSLPVAQANPDFQHIYSCDYSWTAVQLLQSNPQFQPDRMTAFVADVTSDNLSNTVPLAKVDVVTCIFVLSANKPDSLPNVVRSVKVLLRPRTGTVVVRDYAEGDLAEYRLRSHGAQRKIASNFYIRGDGTRCYYFTQESLCRPFMEHGLVCRDVRVLSRVVVNRKTGLRMNRRWIQAVFCMPPGPTGSLILPREPGDTRGEADTNACDSDCKAISVRVAERLSVIEKLVSMVSWPSSAAEFNGVLDRPSKPLQVGRRLFGFFVGVGREEFLAAQILASHPSFHGRRILDAGSGIAGVCGLAAVGACSSYVFLYPDATYQLALRANLRLNAHHVICERVRLASQQQLSSALVDSTYGHFDCLVVRTSADASLCLVWARTLLPPGGLVLAITTQEWAPSLEGVKVLLEKSRVICVKV